MELKCTVTHKYDCSYGKLPTSTSTEPSKGCDCGADDIIAFINYQAMNLKSQAAEIKRLAKENEDIKTAIVDLMQRYAV